MYHEHSFFCFVENSSVILYFLIFLLDLVLFCIFVRSSVILGGFFQLKWGPMSTSLLQQIITITTSWARPWQVSLNHWVSDQIAILAILIERPPTLPWRLFTVWLTSHFLESFNIYIQNLRPGNDSASSYVDYNIYFNL